MPATMKNTRVKRFVAHSLADAANETPQTKENPEGSCLQLVNLVPDRVTPGFYGPRPGAQSYINLIQSDLNGVVSVYIELNGVIYGMVLSVSLTPNEVPFAYSTITNSYITVTGQTSGNTPSGAKTTLLTDWNPPTMALVGSKIYVTHPGFSGSNFFGVINISNPSSPTWTAGDLTGAIQFATAGVLPIYVINFNGRAYWAVNNNSLVYSDIGNGGNCTNASQVLTIGDNNTITALAAQPFTNTTTGGVVQALAIFKQFSIIQVTGDAALSNLTVNAVVQGIGCSSPRAIAGTPMGLMFPAADGIRILQLSGAVSDALTMVKFPFVNIINPTRASAAFNNGCYRICLDTSPSPAAAQAYYSYDYDLKFGWSGPHPLTWANIIPFGGSFLVSGATGVSSGLFTYNNQPSGSDTYTDSGYTATPNCMEQTARLQNEPSMQASDLLETQVRYLSGGAGETVTVSAITPQGTQQTQTFTGVVAGTLWGSFIWGAANWNYSQGAMQPYRVPWADVIPFDDLSLEVHFSPLVNQRIGWFESRIRELPISTVVTPP